MAVKLNVKSAEAADKVHHEILSMGHIPMDKFLDELEARAKRFYARRKSDNSRRHGQVERQRKLRRKNRDGRIVYKKDRPA